MTNNKKRKVLKIKLPKEYDDEKLIRDYCIDVGESPWEMRKRVGHMEAAMMKLDPFNGPKNLRWMLLTYFFAGMKFARDHKKTDYEWKFVTPEEKKKLEEKENDRDTSYFG